MKTPKYSPSKLLYDIITYILPFRFEAEISIVFVIVFYFVSDDILRVDKIL